MQRNKMITASNKEKTSGKINIDSKDEEIQRNIIADFGAEMDQSGEFIKQSDFCDFENGNQKTALKPKDVRILDAFCEVHVGKHESESNSSNICA